jgi:hypothetical protein
MPPPENGPPPGDPASRTAGWTEDLRVLAAELERRHPDLHHVLPAQEFSDELARLRASIPHRDDAALTLDLVRLVASLGDAHTTVSADFQALGFHRLPLSLYLFDDGVYIHDADAHLARLVGARVRAIHGHGVDTVAARLAPFVAHENEAGLGLLLPGQMVLAEVLLAAGLGERVDSIALDLDTPDGRRHEETLATVRVGAAIDWNSADEIAPETLPLHRRHTDRAYWYHVLEGDHTLYIAYNRAANDPTDPFDAFAERAVRLARESNLTRVIVDFRRNSGGNSGIFAALQRRLSRLGAERPGLELVGIIGRQTFSSGMWNAVEFQRDAGATLYGEPTGGRPNHFGEIRQITLPYSRTVVNHSTRTWRLIRDRDPSSLFPDVAVPRTAGDHFALRDPVLDRILGH